MAAIACPRCRTALPAGSMFCNACGTPLNPAVPPGGTPRQPPQAYPNQAYPTQGYPPQAYPNQAAGNVTQAWPAPNQPYAGAVPPGYTPTGQYAAVPEAPAKKPVALLIALLLLLTVGVGGASVYFIRRQANPLTSGATGQVPSSPGVSQGVAPGMPASPNIASGEPTPPPGPSSPVTAGVKPPDGMAPSILMSPGSRAPSSPSVVQSPGVSIPEAPSITQGMAPQAPDGPSMAAAPTAPPAPDNSDLDRYIRWLQYVERERADLRAQGETQIFSMIPDLLGGNVAAIFGDDPDVATEQQRMAQMQQSQINKVNQIVRAMQLFAQNIRKTKPPVPTDCKALDTFYMGAMDEEARQTVVTLDAFSKHDIGRLRQVMRTGVGGIDAKLGSANLELQRVFKGRGLNQVFTIETGRSSSVFGGLVGSLGGP